MEYPNIENLSPPKPEMKELSVPNYRALARSRARRLCTMTLSMSEQVAWQPPYPSIRTPTSQVDGTYVVALLVYLRGDYNVLELVFRAAFRQPAKTTEARGPLFVRSSIHYARCAI
jgi:hypothetical protein